MISWEICNMKQISTDSKLKYFDNQLLSQYSIQIYYSTGFLFYVQ